VPPPPGSDPDGSPAPTERQRTRLNWAAFDAVLFDLYGVITPTAEVHQRAWGALFADYEYTPADYLAHIDGKPRYDGVRSFLEARSITLPEGDPSDPPGRETVCAMGNQKDELFNLYLADGVDPYPGTLELLDHLDALGLPQAIVSSSKNARDVLATSGLGTRFPVVVDGRTAVDEQLPGKPNPAMFLRAAQLLGVAPATAVVVEDAVSGIAAGVAGAFSLVLGVNRGGNAEALSDAGAHLVTNDLGLTLAAPSGHDSSSATADLPTEGV
jgi:HAD superfamily hydrolase (TIGR01509 family)